MIKQPHIKNFSYTHETVMKMLSLIDDNAATVKTAKGKLYINDARQIKALRNLINTEFIKGIKLNHARF